MSENSTTRTWTVSGMTCGHCVSAITEEVTTVDGVTLVEIDLDSKVVSVTGGDDAAVIAAIDEAGYSVT